MAQRVRLQLGLRMSAGGWICFNVSGINNQED